MTGKADSLENYMPPERSESTRPSNDEQLAAKLQGVMMKLGANPELSPAPPRTDDEFRQHMWQLMEVTIN